MPGPEKKVFGVADPHHKYIRVSPINFFVFEYESQNDVVDRFIDNNIFSECQELTSDVKVARRVDEKIDFQLKTYKILFVPKSGTRFYLGLPHGVFADSNCGAIFELIPRTLKSNFNKMSGMAEVSGVVKCPWLNKKFLCTGFVHEKTH